MIENPAAVDFVSSFVQPPSKMENTTNVLYSIQSSTKPGAPMPTLFSLSVAMSFFFGHRTPALADCLFHQLLTDSRYGCTYIASTSLPITPQAPEVPSRNHKLELKSVNAAATFDIYFCPPLVQLHSHAAQKAGHEDVQHQPDRHVPSVAASTHVVEQQIKSQGMGDRKDFALVKCARLFPPKRGFTFPSKK